MILRAVSVLSLVFLFGCQTTHSKTDSPRILAMGDSLMAAHGSSGRAIPNVVARNLNEPVINKSMVGARIIYALPITGAMGLNIEKQFRGGSFDWVIINGGGNDLWLGCGCHSCDTRMERMISRDGENGRIPLLIDRLRSTGAQILWIGYLRSPGVNSPIESCKDEGDELEARLAALAMAENDVHFLSIADLVPYGDRSYHGFDMIHPSLKASAEIAARVTAYISAVDATR